IGGAFTITVTIGDVRLVVQESRGVELRLIFLAFPINYLGLVRCAAREAGRNRLAAHAIQGATRSRWEKSINRTRTRIRFFAKLYDRDGELTLQGNIGLLKVERLFPDYVT